MRSRIGIILISIARIGILPAIAQEIPRETWLDEVKVVGIPPEEYAAGSNIKTVDSTAQVILAPNNLGELLTQHSSLYFKEYGNGMLSTVSFRGTAASHTAVIWNGLNLNSLTLGSTDFSNLPIFMFDDIHIHHGSASALYGSDAVGGSIVLQSQPEWIEGYQLQLVQNIGSFGQNFSGIKGSYGQGKWEGKTTTYYYHSHNDFPFKNTAKYGYPEEKQQNASVRNYGIMQELGYHFSTDRYLYLHTWYEDNENDIQPIMGNNLNTKNYEHIYNRHFRMALDYHQLESWGNLSMMAGFVNDHQVYNDQAQIATSRFVAQATYEKKFTPQLGLKTGGNWQYIKPNVENYKSDINQKRYDLFSSFRYVPYDFWELSFNARQAFVTGFRAPFTPSMGSELTLYQQKNRQLILKNQAARSYRIPTFNDLYWERSGNPNLRPEDGWSVEGGLQYTQSWQEFSLSSEATYYRMWIDEWILWRPKGTDWSPENIREVLAQGIELGSSLEWRKRQQSFIIDAHYAFTSSQNKKALSAFDRSVDKQLPYTPFHRATLNARYQWNDWMINANTGFTGKRYLTTTNESFLKGYVLANLYLGRSLSFWNTQSSLSLRINNIFDKDYQNVNNRAMPGRNYQLTIQIYFSNTP